MQMHKSSRSGVAVAAVAVVVAMLAASSLVVSPASALITDDILQRVIAIQSIEKMHSFLHDWAHDAVKRSKVTVAALVAAAEVPDEDAMWKKLLPELQRRTDEVDLAYMLAALRSQVPVRIDDVDTAMFVIMQKQRLQRDHKIGDDDAVLREDEKLFFDEVHSAFDRENAGKLLPRDGYYVRSDSERPEGVPPPGTPVEGGPTPRPHLRAAVPHGLERRPPDHLIVPSEGKPRPPPMEL